MTPTEKERLRQRVKNAKRRERLLATDAVGFRERERRRINALRETRRAMKDARLKNKPTNLEDIFND